MAKASMAPVLSVVAILSLVSTVAATDYYRLIRRDLRRCASPVCGGYFVEKLNTPGSNLYVGAVDYSKAGKGVAETVDNFTSTLGWGSFSYVVVYGRFVPYSRKVKFGRNIFTLQVQTTYLGLPGQSKEGGQFYTIVKRGTHTAAQKLNDRASPVPIGAGSIKPVQPPYVPVPTVTGKSVAAEPIVSTYPLDLEWQRNQILTKGAIVMGHVAARSYPSLIDIKGVFIKIPVVQPPCPLFKIRCDASRRGYVVETRTTDLCFRPVCVYKRFACIQALPVCPLGYQLAGWQAPPGGCTAYVCDPIFTPRASKLNF